MENNKTRTNFYENEIDFKAIFDLLISKLVWIIAATVTGLLIMFYIASYVITPQYTAVTRLYVNSNPGEGFLESKVQLDLSRKLVETYIVILESGKALETVAEDLTYDISPNMLKTYITVESINDTEVLEIKATTSDPTLSAEICAMYGKNASTIISDITKSTGTITVVSEALEPSKPSSPNVLMFSLMGAMLGFLLMAAIIIIIDMIDNTIKDAEQIRTRFSLPVLGEVPSFEEYEKGGYVYVQKKEEDSF